MKRILKYALVILLATGFALSTGCEQLGLSKKEDDNSLLLLLGLAALQNQGGSSGSGFFVTIPAGVAK